MSGLLLKEMIEYYSGDVKRINHFVKVYGFAKGIGEEEGLTDKEQKLLETVAILHDIGIKVSEEKYNSSAGKYQEIEGPAIACEMLKRLDYMQDEVEKICYIIGHHHTYNSIKTRVHQILVEADFLVNIAEDEMDEKQICNIKIKIFKTNTGIKFLEDMYGV